MNEKFCILIRISLNFAPLQGSNWQEVSIGSGNGLVPNRRQAIAWTNSDPVHWYICGTRGRWVKQFYTCLYMISLVKQPWWIWINSSPDSLGWDGITTTNKTQQKHVHIQWDIIFLEQHDNKTLFQIPDVFHQSDVIKAPHYWPFVRGIHQWPVDSPCKRANNVKIISMSSSWRHHVFIPVNSPQIPRRTQKKSSLFFTKSCLIFQISPETPCSNLTTLFSMACFVPGWTQA